VDVDVDSGVRLFVREVMIPAGVGYRTGEPIFLLHGARVSGLASFDLSVPGGSIAADLAKLGFDVYVMDVRGYGRSTRAKEMDEQPSSHAPLVRSNQSARDISAVVDSIRHRRGVAVLFFSAGDRRTMGRLLCQPVFGEGWRLFSRIRGIQANSQHALIGHSTDSEGPAHPGRFNQASQPGKLRRLPRE
jgi:hypothetical protein